MGMYQRRYLPQSTLLQQLLGGGAPGMGMSPGMGMPPPAPREALQSGVPAPMMPERSLASQLDIMPNMPMPPGPSATPRPPGMGDLRARDVFGMGLAQALMGNAGRPAGSIGEALGSIGSALMAAPGYALQSRQGEFYNQQATEQEQIEREEKQRRQAVEDARQAKLFAEGLRESRARSSAAEQIKAGRLELVNSLAQRAEGNQGALAYLKAYANGGNEAHLKAAQKAIEEASKPKPESPTAVPIEGSGGKAYEVTLSDGRKSIWTPRAEAQKFDPDAEPIEHRLSNGGLLAVWNNRARFFAPNSQKGVDVPVSAITSLQKSAMQAAQELAVASMVNTSTGEKIDLETALSSPEYQEKLRKFYDQQLDFGIESFGQARAALEESMAERQGKSLTDAGVGEFWSSRFPSPDSGDAAGGAQPPPRSIDEEQLLRILDKVDVPAEGARKIPSVSAPKRLSQARREYEELKMRVGPKEAMEQILRKYGLTGGPR